MKFDIEGHSKYSNRILNYRLIQGIFQLWRGMCPALLRHAIYTGMRMTVYEEVRSSLQKENKVYNCFKYIFKTKYYICQKISIKNANIK